MSTALLSMKSLAAPVAHRRLVIIPALFLLLIIFTLVYTIHSLDVYKTQVASLELIAQQRTLRARYMRDVLLETQGIKTHYDQYGQQVEQILALLDQGGVWYSGAYNRRVQISAPPSERLKRELQLKRQTFLQLRTEVSRFLTLPPGGPQSKASLERIAVLNTSLDDPKYDLLKHYITETSSKLYGVIWLEMLMILLVGGLGIALTLQQRKADRILMDNEERFRQIFGAAPIGKALLMPDGRCFKVNPAMCALLGYSEPELLGKSFQELMHADDVSAEFSLREELLKGEIRTYRMNRRYRHKDGRMLWVLATTAVVRENGQPQYLVVQLLDITDQKRTMEALMESEARFRSVIDTATDGIIISDAGGRIQSANAESGHIFGYRCPELAGKLLVDLIPNRYKMFVERNLKRLAESGHSERIGQQLEIAGLRHDGHEFPMEVSFSFWLDPSGERFYTSIIRDITERKRAEKERQELIQSNKDLEEFAIIASHDLQEPLRKIAFYTERFSNQNGQHLEEEAAGNLVKVLDSTRRMQNLIADLLAYSRVSARGRRFCQVSLEQVIHEVMSDLERAVQEADAVIELDSLPVIEADHTQMGQLFGNLIENALKYRRAGVSPHIRIYGKVVTGKIKTDFAQAGIVEDELTSGDVEFVEIRVEDNGIGFDEKYLDKIFKVFQRLHGREQYSGTGIGLATCRRIVERHNGGITAISTPGAGSTFIIRLPLRQAGTREGNTSITSPQAL